MLTTAAKQVGLGLLIYVVVIILAVQEPVQRALLYINWVNIPFPSKLASPHELGLPEGKVRNFKITSTDGVELGAWHILPTKLYEKEVEKRQKGVVSKPLQFEEDFYLQQLLDNTKDVVIYFHGNAANRGQSIRFPTYEAFASQLDSHVIAIDYRGFGDSTGTPSEDGLHEDGLATWNWLTGLGVDPSRISVCGHSLGTGVSVRLVSYLNQQHIAPKALILTAAYSSIIEVMFDYRIFGFLPLLTPLKTIPNYINYTDRFLKHRFHSLSHIPKIRTPLLLFHGTQDTDIHYENSWRLFNATVGTNPYDTTVTTTPLPNIGTQSRFLAPPDSAWSPHLPHSSLVIIDTASHNNVPEHPIFARAISEFWAYRP